MNRDEFTTGDLVTFKDDVTLSKTGQGITAALGNRRVFLREKVANAISNEIARAVSLDLNGNVEYIGVTYTNNEYYNNVVLIPTCMLCAVKDSLCASLDAEELIYNV